MTPALKAMVEAMVAEVSRQVYTDYTTEDPSPEPFVNDLVVDGRLDLEKVARAGLEAIKSPGNNVLDARFDARMSEASTEEERWQAGIDAILKKD